MKTLQISISPPITEWCRKCDYAKHYSFVSMRVKCPDCGNSSIARGPKLNSVVFVWVSKGSYGIKLSGGLTDEQYCYTFSNMPLEKPGFSILCDNEYDTDDLFELILELSSDNSIDTRDKILIDSFIKYVDANPDYKEYYYRASALNKKIKLEYELYELNEKFNFY